MLAKKDLKKFKFLKRLEKINFGGFFTVTVDEVIGPQGQGLRYHTLRNKPFPIIVPVDEFGKIHMIEQHRYSTDQYSIELPMGFVDKNETVEEAARRELEEELGLGSASWSFLGESHAANGVAEHRGQIYLAQNVKMLDNPRQDPIDEGAISHHLFYPVEIVDMIAEGKIVDADSITAFVRYFFNVHKYS